MTVRSLVKPIFFMLGMTTVLAAQAETAQSETLGLRKGDPSPQPSVWVVALGQSYYQLKDLQAFSRLVTNIQAMTDPKFDPFNPGNIDQSPIDQVQGQFVSPIDPNLFNPGIDLPQLEGIDIIDVCEGLFAETWPDNLEAQECACNVYKGLHASPYLSALAYATLAGNRVASGGSCW